MVNKKQTIRAGTVYLLKIHCEQVCGNNDSCIVMSVFLSKKVGGEKKIERVIDVYVSFACIFLYKENINYVEKKKKLKNVFGNIVVWCL